MSKKVTIPTISKLAVGSSAKSTTINNINDSILVALSTLDELTADLYNKVTSMLVLTYEQGVSMAETISSLNILISGVDRQSSAVADFYVNDYVGGGTAEVWNSYGQVTIPHISLQEKLIAIDAEDTEWIPTDTKVYYGYGSSEPDEYTEDTEGINALTSDITSIWYRNDERSDTEADFVWIKVAVPGSANANALANAITLHPIPEFSLDLYDVIYSAGAYGTTKTSADLTYITGWDGTAVRNLGRCRVWIPSTNVSEVILKLKPRRAGTIYGFQNIGLQLIEFDATGNLIVDFSNIVPDGSTIKTVSVYGKDQSSLTYLGKSIAGTEVTLNLSQYSANHSPVITSVKVTW